MTTLPVLPAYLPATMLSCCPWRGTSGFSFSHIQPTYPFCTHTLSCYDWIYLALVVFFELRRIYFGFYIKPLHDRPSRGHNAALSKWFGILNLGLLVFASFSGVGFFGLGSQVSQHVLGPCFRLMVWSC